MLGRYECKLDNPRYPCTWRNKETGECNFSRSCEYQRSIDKKLKYELTDHEWSKFKLHKEFDPSLTDEEILEVIQGTRKMKETLEKLKG